MEPLNVVREENDAINKKKQQEMFCRRGRQVGEKSCRVAMMEYDPNATSEPMHSVYRYCFLVVNIQNDGLPVYSKTVNYPSLFTLEVILLNNAKPDLLYCSQRSCLS